ncbi:hypothetical protein E7T09_20805 [Deinococcus sp. KSM4-11]|uniref:hypothetical protein n=1 Tax=Deinococcus sp. KSM4-11 TaxID=2568654 RepID=UPI0010A2B1C9|nr:hypothetical protein [Deinococcus sp. KSM4-11]THF83954.1 hypothetical protein E7T09_20805 [Deinococcus sp. KSM4-11]
MKILPVVGAPGLAAGAPFPSMIGWRFGPWEYHGEWLAHDIHLRTEREVRLARQRGAESLLERLTR